MTETTQETSTFHSENMVLQLALWSKIVGWLVLVVHLIDLAGTISSIAQQWATITLPPGIFEQIVIWNGLLDKPLTGLFYFLVLQGVAQVLYLGLDMFFDKADISEE